MILILGGTTEGRKVVGIAEEAGKPYYYSTKGDEQEISLQHGIRLTGALTQTTMKAFCRENGIRLLVDAAHPFAEQLHATVTAVSQALGIPCVRYERMYDDLFKLFNEEMYDEYPLKLREKYEELLELLNEEGIHRVLALTGVQSIPKLKPFWKKKESECYFRILDRESSREIVRKAGFPEDRLVYYTPGKENLPELLRQLSPEVVLLKESGVSGGFSEKVNIITEQGIRLYILLRPSLPPYDQTVNGVNGMRRAIEHFLPDFLPLRSGLTTGTCATAAANAALRKLLSPIPGNIIKDVSVLLPNGEKIAVPVHSVTGSFTDRRMEVSCTVIKDGGDDPDVTNGLPIVATVSIDISEEKPHTGGERQQVIQIHGGQGVGTVTLPGLGLEVGGPAINTTPRQMITENLLHILDRHTPVPTAPIHVTISVPGGEEVAARTFNPRLGVVGGISIIGTSGIVKPFSSEAFVNSIRKEMSVARATGSPRIVINSGAKSEKYIRSLYPELPSQAFVHYGNFIGETIRIAAELGIRQLTLGVMIGKAVKLAEGHLDTHSKKVTMNKEFLKEIARQSGCNTATVTAIEGITLARELWELLPEAELQTFCSLLIEQCHRHCDPLLPNGELTILLITEEGKVIR
ncbi:cobalt-precorrin-5B (C(1))-methyltransferase CbiD [Bacteroides fragilis]|uniref:cobalt-precorrin-5B (C(1))-methyltransferase CbiD n=1 Tax=Bacteroides fragilis TaxID=817 RepID=UPI002811584C|nr:cobalt-precorrin-5B (C(1))-methyltransferase CbiD [Bacteroides fragilis]WMI95667.1 cobalt-precorrin-5B (C(1))-methyltransferase CbiD [Bacteroides fragilis]